MEHCSAQLFFWCCVGQLKPQTLANFRLREPAAESWCANGLYFPHRLDSFAPRPSKVFCGVMSELLDRLSKFCCGGSWETAKAQPLIFTLLGCGVGRGFNCCLHCFVKGVNCEQVKVKVVFPSLPLS